jgi:hypothetical protein
MNTAHTIPSKSFLTYFLHSNWQERILMALKRKAGQCKVSWLHKSLPIQKLAPPWRLVLRQEQIPILKVTCLFDDGSRRSSACIMLEVALMPISSVLPWVEQKQRHVPPLALALLSRQEKRRRPKILNAAFSTVCDDQL